MFYFYDGSDGFDGYDYLSFNSLEKVIDHEYYNIQVGVQYPILTYDKDGLPTIILPSGELFELNEYEVKDVTIVEEVYLDSIENAYYEYFDSPYGNTVHNSNTYDTKIHKEDEIKYCTQSELNRAIDQAEEILVNHTIDLALKSKDLKGSKS